MRSGVLKSSLSLSFLLMYSGALAADNLFTTSSKAKQPVAEAKIVGGEQAIPENWPWMTAFVFTFTDIATSLSVDNISYSTASFTSGAGGTATGALVDCGIGDSVCTEVTGNVCLIERGDVNFSEKSDNCEAGGGIAAIIYNNEETGNISGTLGDDYTGTIPVVAITRDDGLTLLQQLGTEATVSVSESSELLQDASCGASFLGKKWVLTAAHCVDGINASRFKMNVGEYDLSDGAENAIDIENIFIHPLYNEETYDNDIALVELVSSVDLPGIQIAEQAVTNQYSMENSEAIVAGWGGRVGYAPGEGPTSDFPDILHKVDLRLTTNAECRAILGDSFNSPADTIDVSDVMICASFADGGKGSCQGDSGGPLVINTGTGVQQVGIVSWGYGCAEEGFPGVFTRVSEFKNWITAITQGIAITQSHNFDIGLEGQMQSTELELANNSDLAVGLSFQLTGSSDFSVDTSNCVNLEANNKCLVTINYLPSMANDVLAELIIATDNGQVLASSAFVSGVTLLPNTELATNAGTSSDAVTLFTGGSNGSTGWIVSDQGIDSGVTEDSQDSILVAQIQGEGTLTFNWAVSSEENTDLEETDPDFEPYDALFLYVNGELSEFISGEVESSEITINLAAGTNNINWTYAKDPNAASGQDKGFINNLVFTPKVVTPAPSPPSNNTPPPTASNSSGGGSLGWMLLAILGVTSQRRKTSSTKRIS